jgi:2-oxoisovalerate dehydrogenase E2 component (dihydrolipoyl transacylase)
MGKYTFRLPDIGEGIAEAEIVAWHVKLGDRIEEDGRIADMMTDKATVEMVIEVAGEVGDVIAIGSPLVVIEVAGEVEDGPSTGSGRADVLEKPAATEPVAAPKPPPPPAPIPTSAQAEPVEAPASRPARHAKVLASPAVRARAKELGIDLAQVKPAEDGRLRHADLDAFLAYNAAGGFRPAGALGVDQDIKVVGLRRRIAENMAASKRHIPHFSYIEECDATALEVMRAQLNSARGNRPKLTMLPLLIAAICRALGEFPMLPRRPDGPGDPRCAEP